MAFFGLTSLGYQSPFADRMLDSALRKTPQEFRWDKMPACSPLSSSSSCSRVDTQAVSHQSYRETSSRVHTNKTPNQLYRVPLTDNQQYGWWLEPSGEHSPQEPWSKVQRFPRKNSEMTKFVKEMSMTDREFSLF